ncbi:amino acid permease [Streptomyces sp. NPDC001276]|uniref:amino acid permease n=1 Tax=unclassified Streptomyces TaxID=2593676 RepID=UPI0035E2C751
MTRQVDEAVAAKGLQQGLRQRHLTMIGIGGVIGAGLFVGSGVVINSIGPASVLTYVLAGTLIVLVIRMLGEMASTQPSTGSFANYARTALGSWAGFSVGWLYWYFWVIVVGFEAVAGAKILSRWLDAPLWLLSLGLLAALTGANLISVRSYGEFEYWFASIKVVTIVVFLVAGTCFVLGVWPGRNADLSNLTAHGGFFPHGVSSIFSGIVVVIFSLVGAEVVTIAAAESEEPTRAVIKATSSVVTRVLVFFVGSVLLVVTMLPWNSSEVGASPYVSALDHIGLPAAAEVMNLVVLTSVLSCLNSGLYTASRMVLVLAGNGEAPRALLKVGRRGVPVRAVLASTAVGYGCVVAAYLWPDTIFMFLLNSSGAVVLFVYLLITASQLRLRQRIEAEAPELLRVRMWLFPWLTYATGLAIVAILVSMYFIADSRSQLLLSLVAWGATLLAYLGCRAADRARAARMGRSVSRSHVKQEDASTPG